MNKELEKWALQILKKYQKVLLLDSYLLTFKFSSDVDADDKMHSLISYPYREIIICYGTHSVGLWEKKKKEELTQTLIHELAHTLTNGLYEKARSRYLTPNEIKDENESLVDHIANIIVKSSL
jgi:protein required for attachment to host cells